MRPGNLQLNTELVEKPRDASVQVQDQFKIFTSMAPAPTDNVDMAGECPGSVSETVQPDSLEQTSSLDKQGPADDISYVNNYYLDAASRVAHKSSPTRIRQEEPKCNLQGSNKTGLPTNDNATRPAGYLQNIRIKEERLDDDDAVSLSGFRKSKESAANTINDVCHNKGENEDVDQSANFRTRHRRKRPPSKRSIHHACSPVTDVEYCYSHTLSHNSSKPDLFCHKNGKNTARRFQKLHNNQDKLALAEEKHNTQNRLLEENTDRHEQADKEEFHKKRRAGAYSIWSQPVLVYPGQLLQNQVFYDMPMSLETGNTALVLPPESPLQVINEGRLQYGGSFLSRRFGQQNFQDQHKLHLTHKSFTSINSRKRAGVIEHTGCLQDRGDKSVMNSGDEVDFQEITERHNSKNSPQLQCRHCGTMFNYLATLTEHLNGYCKTLGTLFEATTDSKTDIYCYRNSANMSGLLESDCQKKYIRQGLSDRADVSTASPCQAVPDSKNMPLDLRIKPRDPVSNILTSNIDSDCGYSHHYPRNTGGAHEFHYENYNVPASEAMDIYRGSLHKADGLKTGLIIGKVGDGPPIYDKYIPFGRRGTTKRDFIETAERSHTDFLPLQKVHVCYYCSKQFSSSVNLQRHKVIHTGEKPFSCEFCERKFAHQSNKRIHMAIHTGEKPFSCHFCEKSYAAKNQLKDHLVKHTGLKSYKCILCDVAFAHRFSLRQHLLLKHPHGQIDPLNNDVYRPFTCDICLKKFTQLSSLKTHKRLHTGLKPFCCPICWKCFPRKDTLTRHQYRHSTERPFKCDMCEKSFATRYMLKQHRNGHTSEPPLRTVCDQNRSQPTESSPNT